MSMRAKRCGGLRGLAKGVATGVVLAALATTAGVAHAEPKPGVDSVTLQDGTVVTGTFTELIPQNRVTVLVGTESQTFQWSLVRKATHAGKVVAENPQVPQAAPPTVVVQPQPPQVVVVQAQPALGGTDGQVLVHVEGDEAAVLEMRGPKGGAFVPMCHAPCDRVLPLDATYRIAGAGLRTSANFQLMGSEGKPIIIDVNPGHKGAFVGGIVMTAIGPVVALAGLMVYGVAAALQSTKLSSDSSGGKTVGGVMMLSGLALAAVGIPLLITNSSTKVTQQLGVPAKDGRIKLRLPEYRDVAHEVPMPGTSYVPVLGLAF